MSPTTIADIKQQNPISLARFTTHEEPLPIWALYLHTAYTFAKTFNPIMVNEPSFTANDSSRSFPADDVETKQQIEITTVENCLKDNIAEILEPCQGYKSL